MSKRGSEPRNTVTVMIAGERHVLRSDADPDYTRRVAQHVDETLRSIGSTQPLQPHRTAILAALFITDELFRTREELERLREEVDSRANVLAAQLERAVAEAGPE